MSAPYTPLPSGGRPPIFPPPTRVGGMGGDADDEESLGIRTQAWMNYFYRLLYEFVLKDSEGAESQLRDDIEKYADFLARVIDRYSPVLMTQLSIDIQDIANQLKGTFPPPDAPERLHRCAEQLSRLERISKLIDAIRSGHEPEEESIPIPVEEPGKL